MDEAVGSSSSSSQPHGQGSKRLQQTQAEVDEVVDIMRVNVEKVLERDKKLTELDDRADALQAGAQQFEMAATRLKRKYWWQNLKMWLILVGVVLVIIIIIIVWVVSTQGSGSGGSGEAGSTPSPAVQSTRPDR